MTIASIAANVLQALNVLLNLPTERALDDVVRIDDLRDSTDFLIRKLTRSLVRVNVCFGQNVGSKFGTDTVQILQGVENLLAIRKVDTCDTGHVRAPVYSNQRGNLNSVQPCRCFRRGFFLLITNNLPLRRTI